MSVTRFALMIVLCFAGSSCGSSSRVGGSGTMTDASLGTLLVSQSNYIAQEERDGSSLYWYELQAENPTAILRLVIMFRGPELPFGSVHSIPSNDVSIMVEVNGQEWSAHELEVRLGELEAGRLSGTIDGELVSEVGEFLPLDASFEVEFNLTCASDRENGCPTEIEFCRPFAPYSSRFVIPPGC